MIAIQSFDDIIEILILMGMGVGWGFGTVKLMNWAKWSKSFIICNLWQKRNNILFLIKELHKPLGAEDFTIGDFQYYIDKEKVDSYIKGKPVLDFELENSVPISRGRAPDPKAPSSRGMKKFIKQNFLRQMIQGTRTVDLKAMVPFILISIIMGVAVGAIIILQVHPGMVQAAPPGYFYRVEPIPANATVVH